MVKAAVRYGHPCLFITIMHGRYAFQADQLQILANVQANRIEFAAPSSDIFGT
jgi:hypothetical protein